MVFCLVDPFALAMIRDFRPDAINLGVHYAPGKDRRLTYREMDAAIMSGVDRACGAVAGICGPRHPILAARAVMEQSEHVLLAGAGAMRRSSSE